MKDAGHSLDKFMLKWLKMDSRVRGNDKRPGT